MDAEEWKVLELAGAFFFDLVLVPRIWFDENLDQIEVAQATGENVKEAWWHNREPCISPAKFFDEHLIRADPSPYEFELIDTAWTDDHHHRIEVWHSDDGDMMHLDVYIDTRYEYSDFLSTIVKFATEADCLFFFRHEQVFSPPSALAVFEALIRSPAYHLSLARSLEPKRH